MTLSKTGVLFGILLFFTILSTFVGIYGQSVNEELEATGELEVDVINNRGFFSNIITGYADLPPAFNLILFGSLGTILLWIAVTSLIPTLDGGS